MSIEYPRRGSRNTLDSLQQQKGAKGTHAFLFFPSARLSRNRRHLDYPSLLLADLRLEELLLGSFEVLLQIAQFNVECGLALFFAASCLREATRHLHQCDKRKFCLANVWPVENRMNSCVFW